MITLTYYFPRNQIGRHILNSLVERVGCSIGEIRRVNDTLAVPITMRQTDAYKIKHILQMYDLI